MEMTRENVRLAEAQVQANRIRMIVAVLVPLLLAAVFLPLIGEIYLVVFEPPPWAQDAGAPLAVLIKVITYSPAIAATVAVITVSAVFAEFEHGRFVSPKASTAFQRAGIWVLAASVLNLFVAPFAVSLLSGTPFNWRFDPVDIALMAFASCVLMIGGVLEAAASSLKAENDQFL